MRTLLLFAALVTLAVLWAVTGYALLGPHPLPARIPTHFDWSGRPDAWGEPGVLWLLPAVGTLLAGLMTLVMRFPQAFHYPVRETPQTRPRLQALTLDMIAWLRLELLVLLFWIQKSTLESALAGRNGLPPWLVPAAIVVVWGTIGWYFWEIVSVGRGRA